MLAVILAFGCAKDLLMSREAIVKPESVFF